MQRYWLLNTWHDTCSFHWALKGCIDFCGLYNGTGKGRHLKQWNLYKTAPRPNKKKNCIHCKIYLILRILKTNVKIPSANGKSLLLKRKSNKWQKIYIFCSVVGLHLPDFVWEVTNGNEASLTVNRTCAEYHNGVLQEASLTVNRTCAQYHNGVLKETNSKNNFKSVEHSNIQGSSTTTNKTKLNQTNSTEERPHSRSDGHEIPLSPRNPKFQYRVDKIRSRTVSRATPHTHIQFIQDPF
jgi:hypothetical protein